MTDNSEEENFLSLDYSDDSSEIDLFLFYGKSYKAIKELKELKEKFSYQIQFMI